MRRKTAPDLPEMPIAPMIDCVFLMLVYFMTTSSLEKSEAELRFPFAAAGPASTAEPAVDEQRIRLTGEAPVVFWIWVAASVYFAALSLWRSFRPAA